MTDGSSTTSFPAGTETPSTCACSARGTDSRPADTRGARLAVQRALTGSSVSTSNARDGLGRQVAAAEPVARDVLGHAPVAGDARLDGLRALV